MNLHPNACHRNSSKPTFLADEMLGRLAKWLRILGYDTKYVSGIPDSELLRIAQTEGRILLTRDTLLIRRKACKNYYFIRSDHWREQLRQLWLDAGLKCEALLTRCAMCNKPLRTVDKESVKASVPAYVYETQEQFSRCENCRRIYWPATHVDKIRTELENLGREP
jgi:uncharacterized protein with PIN domain